MSRGRWQKIQAAICRRQCWGHQEGLASCAPHHPGTPSTAVCPDQGPQPAQALWDHLCPQPCHSHQRAIPPPWCPLPGPGTAGPRRLSPHRHGGLSQPRTRVSGQGGVRRPRPTRRGGPGARGARPVPNPPLFSQGLHFQRSPWDPAPSPRPHAPRKIGLAGACLFAVATAPACDYSCSTARRCGALCASARFPRGAGTPHAVPG